MREYVTKPVTQQQRRCVSQKCDLCGRAARAPGERWEGGLYEVSETEVAITVKCQEGESFPEGGRKTIYEVDICPDCFKGKLLPWFKGQGATVSEKEIDW
mgnify:CR=1 FL=1